MTEEIVLIAIKQVPARPPSGHVRIRQVPTSASLAAQPLDPFAVERDILVAMLIARICNKKSFGDGKRLPFITQGSNSSVKFWRVLTSVVFMRFVYALLTRDRYIRGRFRNPL